MMFDRAPSGTELGCAGAATAKVVAEASMPATAKALRANDIDFSFWMQAVPSKRVRRINGSLNDFATGASMKQGRAPY